MAATKQCADKAEMKRLELHLAIEPVKKKIKNTTMRLPELQQIISIELSLNKQHDSVQVDLQLSKLFD